MLVELARLQDKEVGDGTTSVVLLAAELLKRGLGDLVQKQGLHPTTILAGYRSALKAAIAYIKESILMPVSDIDSRHLLEAARTSMSSKIIGKESEFFAKMAVEAVQSVCHTKEITKKDGTTKTKNVYPLSAIHILKVHGKSSQESYLMKGGFVLNATRASQGMPTFLGNPDDETSEVKIALIDMNLQKHRMAMGVNIQIKDPKEIERIKQREMDLTKEKIQ
jgi:T-complex protein 1 subunit alpha